MQRMLGVDPGGRFTGVVALDGGEEVTFGAVITRTTGLEFPDTAYITEVLDCVAEQLATDNDLLLAVEGITEPNGHMGMMSLCGIMGTAMVLGAVIGRWPDAIVVAPGGNGSAPDGAYPESIRRYARLGGPSTHARSAYDVARVGRVLARANKQGAPR